MARDYKREYAVRSKKGRNDRQYRRIARRLMAKKLGIRKLKNKDVDHKDKNVRNNSTVSNSLYLYNQFGNLDHEKTTIDIIKTEIEEIIS